ncbi:MAG TPA: hypothetical protein VFW01_10580, partial [bacterium]|nr:hypothetical protein [bacterium]
VFILDIRDQPAAVAVAAAGSRDRPLWVECLDTIMADVAARRRLAREVLGIAAARGAHVSPDGS